MISCNTTFDSRALTRAPLPRLAIPVMGEVIGAFGGGEAVEQATDGGPRFWCKLSASLFSDHGGEPKAV